MITLREYMETVDHRITEGSDYFCSTFGTNLYSLSAWNGNQDGWSMNVVFDTKTQVVYLVEACDYKNNRAYRLINPDYKNAFMKDDQSQYRDQAWDDVNYTDLETDDDWIQKALAIRDNTDYDTRIAIPIELDNSTLLELSMMAHEQDITLNELINNSLREYIESLS